MRFGIFDHIDDAGVPLAQLYEDRLRLAELYDRAGFYAYHCAEHHGTPLGLAPSPRVWLASLAQRTRQLRLHAMVVGLLPADAMRPITDRYRAEWEALGKPAAELPLMGLNRNIVLGDSEDEALRIGRRSATSRSRRHRAASSCSPSR